LGKWWKLDKKTAFSVQGSAFRKSISELLVRKVWFGVLESLGGLLVV
jgi:hypothetical protein